MYFCKVMSTGGELLEEEDMWGHLILDERPKREGLSCPIEVSGPAFQILIIFAVR